jgi:hypothetical protein
LFDAEWHYKRGLDTLEKVKERYGVDNLPDLELIGDLNAKRSALLNNQGRTDEGFQASLQAEQAYRQMFNLYAKDYKGNSEWWSNYKTNHRYKAYLGLGIALLNQRKYTEAEQNMLKGYQELKGLKSHLADDTRRVTLDQIIHLYTETNKPDEAKKWQTEKEALKSKAEPAKSSKP